MENNTNNFQMDEGSLQLSQIQNMLDNSIFDTECNEDFKKKIGQINMNDPLKKKQSILNNTYQNTTLDLDFLDGYFKNMDDSINNNNDMILIENQKDGNPPNQTEKQAKVGFDLDILLQQSMLREPQRINLNSKTFLFDQSKLNQALMFKSFESNLFENTIKGQFYCKQLNSYQQNDEIDFNREFSLQQLEKLLEGIDGIEQILEENDILKEIDQNQDIYQTEETKQQQLDKNKQQNNKIIINKGDNKNCNLI